jgi:predicted nucleic acid-binding protein
VTAFFLDTSAIVKRYLMERGSGWIITQTDPARSPLVYLADIARVEVAAAVTRRVRAGGLAAAAASVALANFRSDLQLQYRAVLISTPLLERAMSLAEKHALRGYDAVHLAAALEANSVGQALGLPALQLISADIELNSAAMSEGLAVDDPNAHT